jgi:hypothetical protein
MFFSRGHRCIFDPSRPLSASLVKTNAKGSFAVGKQEEKAGETYSKNKHFYIDNNTLQFLSFKRWFALL